MVTVTEEQVQSAFRKMVESHEILPEIVGAFQVFLEAFLVLKHDTENDRKTMIEDVKIALQALKDLDELLTKGEERVKNLKDGYTPRAGIDYPTQEQITKTIEAMRLPAPVLGVDYFVPTEDEVVSETIKRLLAAPENVITSINHARNQIKPERIEGLEELIRIIKRRQWLPTFAGTSGSSLSTIGAWKTPTETPNGVITVFSVAGGPPTDVVSDGVAYYPNAGYTYASYQITFTIPPSSYVRYR